MISQRHYLRRRALREDTGLSHRQARALDVAKRWGLAADSSLAVQCPHCGAEPGLDCTRAVLNPDCDRPWPHDRRLGAREES